MKNMDAAFTAEELAGFASCLAQVANVKVVVQGPSGPAEVGREDFLRALLTNDPTLAELTARWLEAAGAMRDHIEQHHPAGLLPAEPLRLGACGHVM